MVLCVLNGDLNVIWTTLEREAEGVITSASLRLGLRVQG